MLYGDPGVGKSTLFNTSEKPLLIDFDRGAQRSALRKSVLVVNQWEDVLDEEKEGTFKKFGTIGIDTAKACLDDFLMDFVIRGDYKLRTNKLQAYGAIGDAFKLFVNQRRNELVAIVIIAHAKKDEDKSRYIPDITGQSYSLLNRIADQVGFMSIKNGSRVITWEPTETTIGKNVARLPDTVVPDINDPAGRTFMATLIEKVRSSITALTEEQEEIARVTVEITDAIAAAEKPEDLDGILARVNGLAEYLKQPLKIRIKERADAQEWFYSKEDPAGFKAKPAPAEAAGDKPDTVAAVEQPEASAGQRRLDIIKALGNCGSVDDISDLYHNNFEFIEADAKLDAMFSNAMNTLNDNFELTGNEGGNAAVQATLAMPEAKKVDPKTFKKKYDDRAELLAALEKAADLADVANLYYINAVMVEVDYEAKVIFNAKKEAFTPADTNTPPAAKKGRKVPKKTTNA